jgi:dipeptidase
MGRCLAPYSHRWDGVNAELTPESENLPWALVPDRKVTAEEVKAILSSHYQGTPYNPYSSQDTGKRGMYRSIGINRTGVTSICQIRSGVPEAIRGIEWICFGSTTFDAMLPVYANVARMPKYLSDVSLDVSTENFYWGSRLIGALADHDYSACIQHIERYQDAVAAKGRRLILEYDRRMTQAGDFSLTAEANAALADMAKEETIATLNKVLLESSQRMKNGYDRADN